VRDLLAAALRHVERRGHTVRRTTAISD
jgi:hypothetical protein